MSMSSAFPQTTVLDPALQAPRRSLVPLVLDVVERVTVAGFCLWLLVRLLAAGISVGNLLLAFSEGLNTLLTIIRRPTDQVSRRPWEWLLAIGATTVVLWVVPTSPDQILVPDAVATPLLLVGLLVQIAAKLTLGRSFGLVPAHRGLKLSGPYRLVRHPMYFGYLLVHVGFLLLNPSLWNLTLYVLAYSCQVPRLLVEERLLARDPAYAQYQRQVRFRLIPGVF
jgi:protein-S-isoprenylcysteine O-methyltransferase Ste14